MRFFFQLSDALQSSKVHQHISCSGCFKSKWVNYTSVTGSTTPTPPPKVQLTCSSFLGTLSLSLGVRRARLIRWPTELPTLHLSCVHGLHHDGGKPLGQLWIPFMGIWEHLMKAYVRWTEGLLYLVGVEKHHYSYTCEGTRMQKKLH